MITKIQGFLSRDNQERIPLSRALKKYWKYYLGLFFFLPAILGTRPLIGIEGIWVAFIFILFFGVSFLAMWPLLKKDAPYSFWIIGGVIWITSPIIWIILLVVVSLILGIPIEDA